MGRGRRAPRAWPRWCRRQSLCRTAQTRCSRSAVSTGERVLASAIGAPGEARPVAALRLPAPERSSTPATGAQGCALIGHRRPIEGRRCALQQKSGRGSESGIEKNARRRHLSVAAGIPPPPSSPTGPADAFSPGHLFLNIAPCARRRFSIVTIAPMRDRNDTSAATNAGSAATAHGKARSLRRRIDRSLPKLRAGAAVSGVHQGARSADSISQPRIRAMVRSCSSSSSWARSAAPGYYLPR